MSRRGRDAGATIMRYERCPQCQDGSCRSCGPSSNEHAAPGIRLVVRQVRFVACPNGCGSAQVHDPSAPMVQFAGCGRCGPIVHELAAPGVGIEVIDEHDAKRWVPVVHWDKNGDSACGTGWSGTQLTRDATQVTCQRCLKWKR